MEKFELRRSIRKYSDKAITDEELLAMLKTAEQTQNMGNLQLYSVVVTRAAEMKQRLAPAHFCQSMVTEAPVVLTFCADYRRTTLWCEQREAHPGYDNFLSFMNAATDALLYCQTFCNIAEERGMGLCFLGTTIYNPQEIIETLRLPKLVMPVATITLGYPAEEGKLSERLPIEAVVHRETYEDYTDERINILYKEKEELPDNVHFVEINNKKTLAQVFADIRYTKKDCENISEKLLQALRQQGFLKE